MFQNRLKCTIAAIFATMVFDAFAETQQTLSLSALTEPVLAIPKNDVGYMRYKLTNHGKEIYHLTMQPIPGIVQESGDGSCVESIVLKPNHSCILYLRVSAEETMGYNKLIPQVCVDTNTDQSLCIEPQANEQITLRELPTDKASISVKINLPLKTSESGVMDSNFGRCFSSFATCTLILFQDSSSKAELEVTNTSSTVPIKNLKAYNLPTGVSQDASNCVLVAPGANCRLVFTAGSSRNSGTEVSIYGDNTPTSSVTVQVLGIGDLYNEQQLFQLPSIGNPNFYTAVATDSPAQEWQNAVNSCTAGSYLPTPQQLQDLFYASNCNPTNPLPEPPGPITGFTCDPLSFYYPYYWSSVENMGTVDVIDFSTGTADAIDSYEYAYARCINGYVLGYSLTL